MRYLTQSRHLKRFKEIFSDRIYFLSMISLKNFNLSLEDLATIIILKLYNGSL